MTDTGSSHGVTWGSPGSEVTRSTSSHVPCRTFFSGLVGAGKGERGGNKKRQYSERRVLGYTMDEMFDIVSGVERYNTFVPYCTGSVVFARRPGFLKARMSIGFGPVTEQYVSSVTLARPHLVRSECTEGRLFNHLLAVWQFAPPPRGVQASSVKTPEGSAKIVRSCTLDFSLSFEFRSRLHSRLSNLFFDEVARRMVGAFLEEAQKRYGDPSPVVRVGSGFSVANVASR